MDGADLTALTACPRCDRAPLERTGDGFRCPACRVDFASVGGVPWLFAEPASALGEWRVRLDALLARLEHDRRRLEQAAGAPDLLAPTRARLEHVAAATDAHARNLRELLAPLGLGEARAGHETYLALRTRLPSDQGVATYYQNVHRDWCWGEQENAASLELVRELLAGQPPGRVLVLGAGAGRLAYDVHTSLDATLTVALDFNPLLVLLADRVTRGERIELHEFPLAPRSSAEHAVPRTLSAPAPVRAGFFPVIADAHRPPFAQGAFDTVLTPWLIDILPERFEDLAARINVLLDTGGRWVNFGSLTFHQADPALRYTLEECVAALGAAGFADPSVEERALPYLCSPASRHARTETVVGWKAEKDRALKRAPRHRALPEWLVRGNEPVPLSPSFKTQALSTRIYAFIMSLIDGRRSIKDMAAVLAEQKLMSREDGEAAIRAFLIRMYEDSQRQG